MEKTLRIAGIGMLFLIGGSMVFGQITRTVLQQTDLSIPGREVVTAKAEFPAGGPPACTRTGRRN